MKKPGRPTFKPTNTQRDKVMLLVAAGMTCGWEVGRTNPVRCVHRRARLGRTHRGDRRAMSTSTSKPGAHAGARDGADVDVRADGRVIIVRSSGHLRARSDGG